MVEPPPVVEHVAEKALFERNDLADRVLQIGGAVHSSAALATSIAGQRERHLVQEAFRMVVILYFDTVVGVISSAGRNAQSVGSSPVIVGETGEPAGGAIQDLPAKSEPAIESGVRLPAVDDPRLDLQLCGGKYLNTQAGEKPRSVRRNIRRLIGPVIKVVKAEEAYVREEDTGIDVDPMQRIKVISTVGLVDIPVSIGQIPLPAGCAGVIARRCGCVQTYLAEPACANMAVMKVSTHTQMGKANFIRTKYFAGTANRIVDRVVEVVMVGNVGADFRRKEFRIKG